MGLLDFLDQFFRKKVKIGYEICLLKNSASFGTPVIQNGRWYRFKFVKKRKMHKIQRGSFIDFFEKNEFLKKHFFFRFF